MIDYFTARSEQRFTRQYVLDRERLMLPILTDNKQFLINLLNFTKASVGVREDPTTPNWGTSVKKYLNSVDIDVPASWCAGYVNYQIKNAATHAGVVSHWLASASCNDLYAWAERNSLLLPDPVPNCVFLLRHATDVNRHIHTGFVLGINEDGTLHTREGNTNDDGSANGIGVFERVRVNHHLSFVRIV